MKSGEIILLIIIFTLVFLSIKNCYTDRSDYVSLEGEFPETGIVNTVCRCDTITHGDHQCEWKGLKRVTCPDGREYCCTSDRRDCVWEACRIPW